MMRGAGPQHDASICTSRLAPVLGCRKQELEADRVGMDLAARACFDPAAGKHVRFRQTQQLSNVWMSGAGRTHAPLAWCSAQGVLQQQQAGIERFCLPTQLRWTPGRTCSTAG